MNPPLAEMPEDAVVKALAALAQDTRLKLFRLLVVAGSSGLTPGALVEQLPVGAATVSFHLKELVQAGLVHAERKGRHLVYRVEFGAMNAVLGYLTAHCCQGQSCGVSSITMCGPT